MKFSKIYLLIIFLFCIFLSFSIRSQARSEFGIPRYIRVVISGDISQDYGGVKVLQKYSDARESAAAITSFEAEFPCVQSDAYGIFSSGKNSESSYLPYGVIYYELIFDEIRITLVGSKEEAIAVLNEDGTLASIIIRSEVSVDYVGVPTSFVGSSFKAYNEDGDFITATVTEVYVDDSCVATPEVTLSSSPSPTPYLSPTPYQSPTPGLTSSSTSTTSSSSATQSPKKCTVYQIGSDNCPPCMALKPIMTRFLGGKRCVNYVYIDITPHKRANLTDWERNFIGSLNPPLGRIPRVVVSMLNGTTDYHGITYNDIANNVANDLRDCECPKRIACVDPKNNPGEAKCYEDSEFLREGPNAWTDEMIDKLKECTSDDDQDCLDFGEKECHVKPELPKRPDRCGCITNPPTMAICVPDEDFPREGPDAWTDESIDETLPRNALIMTIV